MSSRAWLFVAALIATAGFTLASSIYEVGEGQQALLVRLGAPIGVAAKPGLKLKAPFIDGVYVYDTRLLLLEPPTEQVILGDQKRLEVQSYARYRIVEPQRFFQALRTIDQARTQLAQLVSSSVRRELGQVPLQALLTNQRAEIVDIIRKEVAAEARPLGIEIDEVRFHRADLPFETSQAIYDRMKSERQREAKELRAQGFEWAQQIQARADRDRTVMLSEAQRAATIARGVELPSVVPLVWLEGNCSSVRFGIAPAASIRFRSSRKIRARATSGMFALQAGKFFARMLLSGAMGALVSQSCAKSSPARQRCKSFWRSASGTGAVPAYSP